MKNWREEKGKENVKKKISRGCLHKPAARAPHSRTAMTHKRTLHEIGAKLPLLDDATLARLEQQVADERKRRKSDSPLTTMRARLTAMEGVYDGTAESATATGRARRRPTLSIDWMSSTWRASPPTWRRWPTTANGG